MFVLQRAMRKPDRGGKETEMQGHHKSEGDYIKSADYIKAGNSISLL